MSLKSLFTTTTNSLTSAVIGTTKLGSVIGSTTEWLAEWGDNLNSDKAKAQRQKEREWDLQQRALELVRQKNELDIEAVKEAVEHSKKIDEALEELFK